jgi:hypothetical protein
VEQVTAQDITTWDADLQTLTDRLSWLFNRPEPKKTFGLMLRALLADVPKKNSWGLAEHTGCPPHARSSTCWMARSGTPTCCAIRSATTW